MAGAGCGEQSRSQSRLQLEVTERPLGLKIVRDGRTIVAEDPGGRLRYKLASNDAVYRLTNVLSSRRGSYRVATNEPGRTATVAVSRTSHGFHVSVQLHPTADIAQVFDSFRATRGEHFLGGGERGTAVDLRGQIVPGRVSYECTYAPVPFFAATAGWGIRLATHAVTGFAFPGSEGGPGCVAGTDQPCSFPALENRVDVCQVGARLDEDVYVGSLPRLLAAYESDAGLPRVPPPSELALIKWRDWVSGPSEVLGDISHLRAAKVPIGWVELDNPWETCLGSLRFDRSRIPDPVGLVRRVHAQGVRFMLWVSPRTDCPSRRQVAGLLGPAGRHELDLRKRATVAAFQARLRSLLRLGVDGFKVDRGDELDLSTVAPTLQNTHPLLLAEAVSGVLPTDGAAIFRAATMGSQAVVPGIWAGDQPGDWQGLQTAIRMAQTAGMSGFPVWGSDIGGYSAALLTPEVFARWAGLGAVSPVMEVGGMGPNSVPWRLGPAAMEALRANAVLHYELFPYLYDLIRRRQPVLRPLGYGYPSDPHSWTYDLELLVGPDLLAAPMTGPGDTAQVYLPPGRWIDLHEGTVADGGRQVTRTVGLATLPLFVRAGAVLPFNLRTARDSWWGVDELTHPGRAGWLATDGAALDLRDQPQDVQVFVPAAHRPAQVTIGNRPVSWSWNAGPLPGVVVRLHGPTVHGRIALAGD